MPKRRRAPIPESDNLLTMKATTSMFVLVALPLLAGDPAPLRAFLENSVKGKQVAGAVVVVEHRGKVVFREAFGLADVAADRRMTTGDLFMMASSTKPFSATTVLTLVDQGKLKLDDPVSKFYPEFRGASTVRQLLSHTSGIFGNDGGPEAVKWIRNLDLSVRDSVAGILSIPPAYEPGTKYSYGGASFEVAGGIVETLAGMDFDQYMRKVLLDPLGLHDTCFRTTTDVSDRVPVMYASKGGVLTALPAITDRAGMRGPRPSGFVLVAGGLYSTGDDCIRFLRMHLNRGTADHKRILSERMVGEMQTRQTGTLKENYGLGWNLHSNGAIGHGGAYGTDIWFHPQHDLAVAVMIQNPRAQPFQQQVRKLVLEIW